MNSYPAMRYHPEKCLDGRVVHSEEQDLALGSGWVEEPSKFNKDPVEPQVDPAFVAHVASFDAPKKPKRAGKA